MSNSENQTEFGAGNAVDSFSNQHARETSEEARNSFPEKPPEEEPEEVEEETKSDSPKTQPTPDDELWSPVNHEYSRTYADFRNHKKHWRGTNASIGGGQVRVDIMGETIEMRDELKEKLNEEHFPMDDIGSDDVVEAALRVVAENPELLITELEKWGFVRDE